MTTLLAPYVKQRFVDANGAALYLGTVNSFAAGTNTPIVTYKDSAGVATNTNPITLNPRGECDIWLQPNVAYKLTVADAAGNLIWTIDNILNSQLITLFGGVDTGSTNAYILNFTANFTAYADGIVIYWIPSHGNTGASTINVNGLGVINITNQDGTALGLNQLQANQTSVIMFKGGAFLLLATGNVPLSSTFIGTLSSGIGAVTVSYYRVGQQVTLRAPGTTSVSTAATSMVMSGLPAAVTPVSGASAVACLLTDNGITIGGWAVVNSGTGTITFGTGINNNPNGFTPSSVRGLAGGWTMTYSVG